jgi:ABC-type sulfate transport system permease component
MRIAANTPVRGWRDRIFSAVAFFFVSVFIVFILGLILTDVFYVDKKAVVTVLTSEFIRHALWMSIWTSFATTLIALLFAVPMGYSLSRFRFPGQILPGYRVCFSAQRHRFMPVFCIRKFCHPLGQDRL